MQKTDVPIKEIVLLAKELIKVPSISGDNEQAVAILKLAKKYLKGISFTSFVSDQVPSLLYSNSAPDEKQFKIILNAHLDVVAGAKKQFVPFIQSDKLFGRGAYDMKAGAAVMIILFKSLAHKLPYPIALQLTTDEETYGINGTAHQLEKGIRSDFMITGECGSNFRIVHESKGMLHIKLSARGKASHSAYPWVGENAILKMYQALNEIHKTYPSLTNEDYVTTVNVIHIQTDNTSKHTITPDLCDAILDVRYVPTEKTTIIQKIQSLLPDNVTLEILVNTPPHVTPSNHLFIKKLQEIGSDVLGKEIPLIKQHATSDARYYSSVNCDGIEFGPIGGGQHNDEEWVSLSSLSNYYLILQAFLLSVTE